MKKARLAALFSLYLPGLGKLEIGVTLRDMNENLRFPIAIMISLLIHFIVLMWIMQQVKEPAPIGQAPLQVFLRQGLHGHDGVSLELPVGAATIKNPEVSHTSESDRSILRPRTGATGHQASNSPPAEFRQDEMMNAMHLAQLARQREFQKASVQAALTNLAVQMHPMVRSRIVCVQQSEGRINCNPESGNKLRPLLEQFFSLAKEARQLGIADNPVYLDFGPEQSVSVKLLN